MLKLAVDFMPFLLPLAISFAARGVLLCLALWFMLKAQDLVYTIPGIIGSALLASVFDMIPMVGHPLAAAVLLMCVLKMTRSHLIDVRFTVGVSYAVTFLLQMLILSALPGDLRVHARASKGDLDAPESAMQQAAMADDETEADEEAAIPVKAKALAAKVDAMAEEKTPTPAVKPAAEKAVATYPEVDKATLNLAGGLKLKGVMALGRDSMVMLVAGGKTYSVKLGETINLRTPNGPVEVKVEQVTADSAMVNVGGKLTPLGLK